MNQRNLYRSTVLTLAVVMIGLPLTATAAAPSQFEKVSVKVNYQDLNIESYSGASKLYKRLQRASRTACDVQSLRVAGSVRRHAAASRCYRDALDAAVRSVDSDALDEIHAS